MISCLILALSCFGGGRLLVQSGPRVADRVDAPSSSENLGEKQILIEAQDLGMAHSIDKASFGALEKGWVTSAGVLAPAPWFPEVVRWAMAHPDHDLGLQLDLNAEWASFRWRSTSPEPPSSGLSDPAGYLPNNARYLALHSKPEEVATEFRAQVDAARRAGLPLTYLNSHGGIELYTPWLFKEYWQAGREAGLPAVLSKEYVLRRGAHTGKANVFSVGGIEVDITTVPIDRIIQIEPGFKAKNWLSAYERTLAALPSGTYMLTMHLGFNDEELQAITVDHPNWGAQWRQNDYDVISSPEFHKFLKEHGFVLIGWGDLRRVTGRN